MQPLDDAARRVAIPRIRTPQQRWTVDAAFTQFEGRTYDVAARSEHVTEEWTIDVIWSSAERPDAEAFIGLLRDVALEPDGRVELHLEPDNGQPVDVVVETHEIPQSLAAGKTETSVTFRRVDTG